MMLQLFLNGPLVGRALDREGPVWVVSYIRDVARFATFLAWRPTVTKG